MKRAIILCIILTAITTAGNAQYFVEGSVAVEYNDATPTFPGYQPEKQYADSYWSVSPLIGYQLSDDFAVGAKANFNRGNDWSLYSGGEPVGYEKIISRWSFAIFCRYKIWGIEKLSLLVEGSIDTGGGSTEEKKGSVNKKIETRSSFGVGASPLITYDISEKWSITTTSSLFYLGFGHETVKNEETGIKTKYPAYSFNARSSLAAIPYTIGFIYHF